MTKYPQFGAEYKLVLKDSPNFIGVAKGEDKLRMRVNEILAEARTNGDLDQAVGQVAGPSHRRSPPVSGSGSTSRMLSTLVLTL